jgi:flavin-dependent thymidylate synthase
MNKNTVELLGHYGSDEIIALSAWTSTSRNLSPEKRERIPKLIKDLWKNGHETPFEKASVHFLVNCDIASHIHLLKHRISSLNAESARYKELKEDKFYLPGDWDYECCTENIYPGILLEGEEVPFAERGESVWLGVLQNYTELGNRLYHQCVADLTPVLGRKRAKESARYFKTYNSQITADVQFNMRSFANFLKLRWNDHAQVEISDIASEMFAQVSRIEGNPFKTTLECINPHNPVS